MSFRRLPLAIALALGLSLPLFAQDKFDVNWKFEKDKTFYQEMTTTTNQTMKVQGMDVTQKQAQTLFFSFTPKEQDKDANWKIVQKIEGIKMSIDLAGNPISYDSTNPGAANNALAEFFKSLVGTEFTLTVDKNLKVTKVDGRDEFLKKLGASNTQMEPLLKQILSDEAMKQMADPTFGLLPAKSVAKGETWTRETLQNLGPIGNYKNTYKCTAEGVDGDNLKIKVETTMAYTAPVGGSQGLPFNIKSANLTPKDGNGTILFNPKKSRVDKVSLTQKLEGDLNIEIGNTTTKVDLKQEQSTTITTSDSPQVQPPKK